jgi:hypothetical protein
MLTDEPVAVLQIMVYKTIEIIKFVKKDGLAGLSENKSILLPLKK